MATSPLFLPELLEEILLYLPVLEILHLQCVCSTWRASVERSPRIQQAVFFRGTSAKPVHWHIDEDLEFESHWCDLPNDTEAQREISQKICAEGHHRADLLLNPFFAEFVLHSGISSEDGRTWPWDVINYQASGLPWSAAQQDSTSSINHMLLSDPPTTELQLMLPGMGYKDWEVRVCNPHGVTVKDIAAVIELHIADRERTSQTHGGDLVRGGVYGKHWTVAGFAWPGAEWVQSSEEDWAVYLPARAILKNLAVPYSDETQARVMAQVPDRTSSMDE
ncbi:hypothetical protein LTR17_011665 [Elasticomyces elasticus]|nr:hypothetical protein LTR17_011665 [Elasticomyces elasticus]